MTPEFAVHIMKQALMTTIWVSGPLLLIGLIIGIVINLIQIVTSMQDSAFSAVPRLAAFLIGFIFLMPWMLSRMMDYTISILGDLPRYAR